MNENIILIGFMGCGKTTIGKKLAASLNYSFLDTDECIEQKEKQSIKELFKERGETYFRACETKVLETLNEETNRTVISTGGGMAVQKQNVELLRALGVVIYLSVTSETVMKRLRKDESRPLLQGENGAKRIKELLESRLLAYKTCCHYQIVTDGKDISTICLEIQDIMTRKCDEKKGICKLSEK